MVMKLYRDHFAPNLLAVEGDTRELNATATKSADGNRVFVKVVGPADRAIEVRLTMASGFTPARAILKLVAPESLAARNSLERPHAAKPVSGPIRTEENRVVFTLPGWSVGVAELRHEEREQP